MRRLPVAVPLMAVFLMSGALETSLPAVAGPLHHRRVHLRYGEVHYGPGVRYRRFAAGIYPRGVYPPLTQPEGVPLRPEVARFMGFPYNLPSYRYEYADGCLLRTGGPFGSGPAAAPCALGLDLP